MSSPGIGHLRWIPSASFETSAREQQSHPCAITCALSLLWLREERDLWSAIRPRENVVHGRTKRTSDSGHCVKGGPSAIQNRAKYGGRRCPTRQCWQTRYRLHTVFHVVVSKWKVEVALLVESMYGTRHHLLWWKCSSALSDNRFGRQPHCWRLSPQNLGLCGTKMFVIGVCFVPAR